MAWTRFMDMHSGGGLKEQNYDYIYIEASEEEAKVIFYNRFGHSPDRITCTCCGEDYSIGDDESLAQLTAFDRQLQYAQAPKLPSGLYDNDNSFYLELGEDLPDGYTTDTWRQSAHPQTLEQYLQSDSVLVVYSADIESEEKIGSLPESGWVWVG